MNTILRIVLAMMLTVFLGAVAIAADDSHALGWQAYGPSISPSEGPASSQSYFSGQVVSVDPEGGTLTVATIERDVSSPYILQGEVTLSTDAMTSIKMCNDSLSLSDIHVGENLAVTYHEKDGEFFADGIALAEPC